MYVNLEITMKISESFLSNSNSENSFDKESKGNDGTKNETDNERN